MARRTQELVRSLRREEHFLGRCIAPEEVPSLVAALRQRLNCGSEELDLLPGSLNALERCLAKLNQRIGAGLVTMGDEDTVRLIREIAAYLGQVVVTNLSGEWDPAAVHLWPGMVWVPTPVEVVKEGRLEVSDRRGYPAADFAAGFWDALGAGCARGLLQRTYKRMTQRRWREML